MNTLTRTLLVVLALTLGACATSGHAVTGNASPTGGQLASSSSSGASQRDSVRGGDVDMDREPAAFARTDRGIPTPQPARDPGAMATPAPQVPIPVEPHRDPSAASYNPHARGGW